MKATDLILEVRDSTYNRVGQILTKDILDLTVVVRYNKLGTWKLTLSASNPLITDIITPGSGIILSTSNVVIISGPTTVIKQTASASDPKGIWEIEGVDDSIILKDRYGYPYPQNEDVSLQLNAYDTRIGKAETIIKEYIKANIGADAPTARKLSNLIIEADSARGETLTASSRFDPLGKFIYAIATVSNLGFLVEQNGDSLEFKIFQPTDKSGTVRMDIENNQLEKTEYIYMAPQATRVIVAGAGAVEQRTFIERTTADSLASEALWGRRIELFHDARSAATTAELQTAGDEILIEKGKTIVSIAVTPNEAVKLEYGKDWGLGDIISVAVNNEEIQQVVSEVAFLVNQEGLSIKATVGDTIKTDLQDQIIYLQKVADDRLDNLERNAEAGATAKRESVVYTSPMLAAGANHSTTVAIAAGYKLLSISATVPSRVRLYTKIIGRNNDINRPITTYPSESNGLMLDYVFNETLLNADLSPVLDGFVSNGAVDVPITVTNLTTSSTPVQITFIYIKTE